MLSPRLLPFLLAAPLLACGQEIVVLDCDGHVDVDVGSADAGFRDTGVVDSGPGGDGGLDAGADGGLDPDSGLPEDGGPGGCQGAPYCLTTLDPDVAESTPRATITLTPTVDNPQNRTLSFRVELAGTQRAPNRPALVPGDITYSLNVDPATGVVTFLVGEVPTWFIATTFELRLYAKGPGTDPEVSVVGSVLIQGNILISSGADVFAMASDGLPARSQNFTYGRFISGASYVRGPKDLLVARDGTLIVYDQSATPRRLRRFDLTGESSLIADFPFEDGAAMPYFRSTETTRGLTQLPDGRFAAMDYSFSGAPKSRIVLWNEDGSYSGTIGATDPATQWVGLSYTPTGDLVTLERASDGRLVAINPSTGAVTGMIATGISNGWSVTRSPDGYYYVGLTDGIIRVSTAGARQMVSGIASSGSNYYQYACPLGLTGMVVSRDYGSEQNNVGLVEGTAFTGWIRKPTNSPYLTPFGLAYLE